MAAVLVPSRFGVGRTEVNGRVCGLLLAVVEGVEISFAVDPPALGQLAAELDNVRCELVASA